MQKRRWLTVVILRKLLTCTICTMGLLAFFSVHVPQLPDPDKLPTWKLIKVSFYLQQRETNFVTLSVQQELGQEYVRTNVDKPPLSSFELTIVSGLSDYEKLWKPPPNRHYVPCVEASDSYNPPGNSQGYLLVHTNGGLNQMRAGICDMVAVARIINATLVIPELDKKSFWQDLSNFADIFDQNHFINSLADDVKVIRKLPKELSTAPRAVMQFRSWSGQKYYQNNVARLWSKYQVIRAAKSDSRLANNNLPPDIQKLRCRACYEALRFSPRIEAMGNLLVDRIRKYGRYIALHLRQNTTHWKVKDINATQQRIKGFCPLTPTEVGIFLSALGYPSDTPIYVAAGEIHGGESRMAELQSRYPILMNKEKLATMEELEPFMNHASQMAALDYIVSIQSDVFIPTYSGNMARAVEGHRRYLGHRKTISPDRRALVRLFDKLERGTIKEGKNLSQRIIELHVKRQGSPRKRKGPISGTRGMDRFRSEEAFYENPLPDCLCQRGREESQMNVSAIKYSLRLV
ncbi:hypothetical protein Cgig2_025954 [Carnegiea gigantea]|uniref:O-fucosyltransferase family protein n=1 Tax=Carnegiea gigantea TaxID=171969 RepID=A0A9Q1JZM9_9CARY|nr:hypothetical protein Cgig2_025954 [Carnegiea gigantea]